MRDRILNKMSVLDILANWLTEQSWHIQGCLDKHTHVPILEGRLETSCSY